MTYPELTYGPITKEEAEPLWETIYQSLHRHAQPGWNEHVGYEQFRAVKSKNKILNLRFLVNKVGKLLSNLGI